MLLLVTGASGVGKSTARARLASRLPVSIEAVELASLGIRLALGAAPPLILSRMSRSGATESATTVHKPIHEHAKQADAHRTLYDPRSR